MNPSKQSAMEKFDNYNDDGICTYSTSSRSENLTDKTSKINIIT